MHEMSLMESALQLVEKTARAQGMSRVTGVWLEIGQLAAVDVEALKFCYTAVADGTLAQDAALEIVITPGIGWCPDCALEAPMPETLSPCPQCGGYRRQVRCGAEMRVESIEGY